MMSYSTPILRVVYILLHPLVLVARWLFRAFIIVTAPLSHLIRQFLKILRLPIHLLGRFEALYIFLGVAFLIGVIAGTSLHHISRALFKVFDLEDSSASESAVEEKAFDAPMLEGHETEQDPWQDETHEPDLDQVSNSPTSLKQWSWIGKRGRSRGGPVRDNVILEEDDSSELGF